MIVSPHWMSTQAGIDIMRNGGNAIEAMISSAAVISVVYPHMNSLGGDNFWLINTFDQKLIGIELLKSHFGHDKYDSELRQRLSHFGPLLLKYASLQYTVKVDTRLKEMLETHYETSFDFINKLF